MATSSASAVNDQPGSDRTLKQAIAAEHITPRERDARDFDRLFLSHPLHSLPMELNREDPELELLIDFHQQKQLSLRVGMVKLHPAESDATEPLTSPIPMEDRAAQRLYLRQEDTSTLYKTKMWSAYKHLRSQHTADSIEPVIDGYLRLYVHQASSTIVQAGSLKPADILNFMARRGLHRLGVVSQRFSLPHQGARWQHAPDAHLEIMWMVLTDAGLSRVRGHFRRRTPTYDPTLCDTWARIVTA